MIWSSVWHSQSPRQQTNSAKGHGKRGGARIIYYWVVAHDRILLLDIYAKNEQEDLNAAELKQLRCLIEDYKL